MKVKAKKPLIYKGRVYKTGEIFEVEENLLGYSFTWLKSKVQILSGTAANSHETEIEDDLVAADGLPPLDEETGKKRGKKNV